MILTHLVAGLVGSYAFISFAEWYIHKYHMHRNGWFRLVSPDTYPHHARVHHPAFQKDFEASNPSEHADIGTRISLKFTLKVLLLPLGLLAVVLPIEAGVFLVMAVAHGVLWNVIHELMHNPRDCWLARTRWYSVLREQHLQHHRHWGTNFNVIALGADHVFGTLYRGRGGKADGNHPIPDAEGVDTPRG